MTAAITVDQLSKQYRIGETVHGAMLREIIMYALTRPFRRSRRKIESLWALRDVSFSIDEGEVVGIVGRNGAGKTTLLKLLSRITYPTSGKLTVRGQVASLVEVGTGFHSELTGRENVYLNGSILGLRKREIDRNFDAIVEFSGVGGFIDTPIKRYSTGMRLRLGFAVAAHLSPNILLVDEVLAVGDVEFQKRCLERLDDVHKSGRTVLFVSHNLEAIDRLCPRTLWIDGGQLREDGDTRDVLSSYVAAVSQNDQASVDLTQSPNRSGTGEARFSKLLFLDLEDRPKEAVQCGDAVRVRLSYRVETEFQRPYFGVMIWTDLGTLVAHLNSWSAELEIPALKPGEGSIDLDIDSLSLMPGRYSVSVWVERYGESTSVDLLEHCAALVVHRSESHLEGRVLDRRAGLVHFPSTWSVRTT